MKDNRLFIFSPMLFNDEMLKNEINTIKTIQGKFKYKFDKIYICILHKLCIIDFNKDKYERILMNKEEFDKISFESADKVK